jgi:hypothetical protein
MQKLVRNTKKMSKILKKLKGLEYTTHVLEFQDKAGVAITIPFVDKNGISFQKLIYWKLDNKSWTNIFYR